jgi:DNA-directed RNA polymerase subunit RPC12/RpoP
MDFAFFEIVTRCSKCSGSLPLSRPEDELTCGHCLASVPVEPRVWAETVRGLPERLHTFSLGGKESGLVEEPGFRLEWLRGRGSPPCPACGGTMSLGLRDGLLVCSACGTQRPLERAPDWLTRHDPNILGVVAEPEVVSEAASRPLAMTCTNCGGALTADGSSRVVPCEYCNSNNLLPDDVWRMFHPPRTLKRFWLLVNAWTVNTELPKGEWSIGLVLGAVFLMGLPFVFLIPGVLALTGGSRNLGLGISFTALGGLGLLVVLWLAARDLYTALRDRGVIRRGVETVGRMHATGRYKHGRIAVRVDVLDPATHSRVIAEGVFRRGALTQDMFDRLGGEGGQVRAWVVEAEPRRNVVEFEPSPLQQ